MISFDKALGIIESVAYLPSTEEISLLKALNRVLAQEVISHVDMPSFNKAAMDGYACRRVDLGNELLVIEEIPAGKVPVNIIAPNQCARILTGAMVPEGADYILIQEHAEHLGPDRVKCGLQGEQSNICLKGEDIRSGDTILSKGTKLLPAHMAILASAGCMVPKVYNLPGIAVISTGDELVEPDQEPVAGKIRNSNGIQMVAQVGQLGLHADYLGIVPDNREIMLETIKSALEKYNLILISGGVAVGDFDFVPSIIGELHMEMLIKGINIKPGKHLHFAVKDGHFIAAMPGNPVSSFVLFEVLVKPFLRRLSGSIEKELLLPVPLAKDYYRRNHETLFFIPVLLSGEGSALPLEYHGSAHIHAYSRANGIMEIPVGINEIRKGEIVHVRPI